jgi:hypothetical protein
MSVTVAARSKQELSSLARTLESWVRIPLRVWMFGVCMLLFCVCVHLCLGRGLATGWSLAKESYRLWKVITELNKWPGPWMSCKSHCEKKWKNRNLHPKWQQLSGAIYILFLWQRIGNWRWNLQLRWKPRSTSLICLETSTRMSISAGLSKYAYGVIVMTAFLLRSPPPSGNHCVVNELIRCCPT